MWNIYIPGMTVIPQIPGVSALNIPQNPTLDLSVVLPDIADGPADSFTLTQGRMHEICGPARRVMAAWVIAALQARMGRDAPVLWLRPRWQGGTICPHGLARIADPRAVVTVRCPREDDLLWCMEEALRTGAAPLIIAELPRPPALTPVRRLHLAAEVGAAKMGADGAKADRGGGCAPTGLILSAGDGGAAGVESRWFAAPLWRGGASAWRLERRRARMAPPAGWVLVDGGRAGSHGQDMYDADAG